MVKKKNSAKYRVTVDMSDYLASLDHVKKLILQLEEVVNRLSATGINVDCTINAEGFVQKSSRLLKFKSVKK